MTGAPDIHPAENKHNTALSSFAKRNADLSHSAAACATEGQLCTPSRHRPEVDATRADPSRPQGT
eukprot:5029340-Alexandrium_andersonii.AAC.1